MSLDLKAILANPDALAALEREHERRSLNRLESMFPDTGPLRRELYVKHLEFFDRSREYNEILFLAANKVGKSVAGSFAAALHATGKYPKWWTGRRFNHPTVGWACNNTNIDCRDINQFELLGQPGQFGTGMIPSADILNNKPKPSVPDAIETTYVRHISGGQSMIVYKAYEQGREKFQGRNIHWIWGDEEVPDDIYTEMLMRIMTTDGLIFLTYTPIRGLTPLTVQFLKTAVNKKDLPIQYTDNDKRKQDSAKVG